MGSCGTCTHYRPTRSGWGECVLAASTCRNPGHPTSLAVALESTEDGSAGLETAVTFGCVQGKRS
jgi:hypothetical protein